MPPADRPPREEREYTALRLSDWDTSPSAPPARRIARWRRFLNWPPWRFARKIRAVVPRPLDRALSWRHLPPKPRLPGLRFADQKCRPQIFSRTRFANCERRLSML